MQSMYYVGLDVHKKTISYCVKDVSGTIQSKGHSTPHVPIWTAG
jgi:transposase